MFREINETEQQIVGKLQTRGKAPANLRTERLYVDYRTSNNTTTAVLKFGKTATEVSSVGWAKRNPKDARLIPAVGEAIAFSRAVKGLTVD